MRNSRSGQSAIGRGRQIRGRPLGDGAGASRRGRGRSRHVRRIIATRGLFDSQRIRIGAIGRVVSVSRRRSRWRRCGRGNLGGLASTATNSTTVGSLPRSGIDTALRSNPPTTRSQPRLGHARFSRVALGLETPDSRSSSPIGVSTGPAPPAGTDGAGRNGSRGLLPRRIRSGPLGTWTLSKGRGRWRWDGGCDNVATVHEIRQRRGSSGRDETGGRAEHSFEGGGGGIFELGGGRRKGWNLRRRRRECS
mmetsp:Transcript_28991/g.59507  ORF Transcript_28991/g.59507 Transcript_28991/m.59507 type:complete len:250 (+) Transcript_28991:123-872(+)